MNELFCKDCGEDVSLSLIYQGRTEDTAQRKPIFSTVFSCDCSHIPENETHKLLTNWEHAVLDTYIPSSWNLDT